MTVSSMFEKCAGSGNAANTDDTDIIFPHPHTVDLDQAPDTKFPLEFPLGSFFTLRLPGPHSGLGRVHAGAGLSCL